MTIQVLDGNVVAQNTSHNPRSGVNRTTDMIVTDIGIKMDHLGCLYPELDKKKTIKSVTKPILTAHNQLKL